MLSTDFPPNTGGIAAHVYELSKALVKEGNDVFVLTGKKNFNDKKYEEIDGIKVCRTYFPRVRLLWILVYALPVWLKLRWLIKNKDIDIIHHHNIFADALIAKFTSKVSKVQTEHSSSFLEARETGKHKRLHRWLLSNTDYVIGPSQELVDAIVGIGVNRANASFIPNGVDTEKFNPRLRGDEIKEKHGIKSDEKVILCPRRLALKNGVYYFVKAIPCIIERSGNVKCLIVGDGPEMAKLKSQASELGTAVADSAIFAGSVPNSEMPKYYAASDIVVLPSLREATSIAGLEAMATGKPLVGTNVGGIPQIIADGKTGTLVRPRNPEELAFAIVSLLNDDEKRAKMGLNARKRTEREFSWQIIARQTQNLYDELTPFKRTTRSASD